MTRLPKPAADGAARLALLAIAREENGDFPGRLAAILAGVAAELGSSAALVAGRPGSWEAGLVLRLVRGTARWDDEHLGRYR